MGAKMNNEETPEITLKIDRIQVNSTPKKLRAKWHPEPHISLRSHKFSFFNGIIQPWPVEDEQFEDMLEEFYVLQLGDIRKLVMNTGMTSEELEMAIELLQEEISK